MSIRVLITLWVVAGSLLAAVVGIRSQQQERITETKLSEGDVLLETLEESSLQTIEVKGGENQVTLTKVNDTWGIAQKDNFPVNHEILQQQMGDLFQAKVAQPVKASEKYHARFGVEEKGQEKGTGSESLQIVLRASDGKALETIFLGDMLRDSSTMMSGGMDLAVGRRVRLASDPHAIYTLSETFSELPKTPKDWLKKDFIKIQTPLDSIRLLKQDSTQWSLNVNSDHALELENLPEGKTLDPAKRSDLLGAVSSLSFTDVIAAGSLESYLKAQDRDLGSIQQLEVSTQSGFQYTLQLAPKSLEAEQGAQLMSYTVQSTFPTEREKKEGETQDEAKRAQMEFEKTGKANQEQLAKEQKLAGYVYEVEYSSVSALLSSKESLLLEEETPPVSDLDSEQTKGEVPAFLKK